MQNVTVLRGGVDEVIAQNCVLFRSSSTFSTMSVTDSIVRNCIVESGADSTGSSFTTSLLTWTQEDNGFVHLAGGDSHILLTPPTPLTVAATWQGLGRPKTSTGTLAPPARQISG